MSTRHHGLAWVALCPSCRVQQVAVKRPADGEKPGERLCENCKRKARRKSDDHLELPILPRRVEIIESSQSSMTIRAVFAPPRAFVSPRSHDPADGDRELRGGAHWSSRGNS